MSRTWVSGAGSDSDACTRTAPCLTFAGALGKTAPGGEINCLDAGGFGPVTISFSVSIVCQNVEAGIIATSMTSIPNGIVINGANAVVTLSGLDLDGFNSGTNGIQFVNGASLVLNDVKIRNFTGYGIRFEPATVATLNISKAVVTGNGSTSVVSGGIYLRPTAAVVTAVTISDSYLSNNRNAGLRVDPSNGSTINTTVQDTISSNNGIGLLFRAPTGMINASITRTTLVNNSGLGLNVNGANVTAVVADSTITANASGLGGSVTSFGNNRLFGNSTNGAFATTVPTQ